MIGTTIEFILVDMGCRQSPGGCIKVRDKKLTLRARSGLLAGNTTAMSTVPSNAPILPTVVTAGTTREQN